MLQLILNNMITTTKLHAIGEKAEKQKCLPNFVVFFKKTASLQAALFPETTTEA